MNFFISNVYTRMLLRPYFEYRFNIRGLLYLSLIFKNITWGGVG